MCKNQNPISVITISGCAVCYSCMGIDMAEHLTQPHIVDAEGVELTKLVT